MTGTCRRALRAQLAAEVEHEAHACPILAALHVGCGAHALGLTSDEIAKDRRTHTLVLHDDTGLR